MNDSNLFNSTSHTITPNTPDDASANNNPTTETTTVDTGINSESNTPAPNVEVEDTYGTTTIDNKGLDPQKDLGINIGTNSLNSNIANNTPISSNPIIETQIGSNSPLSSATASDTYTSAITQDPVSNSTNMNTSNNPFITDNTTSNTVLQNNDIQTHWNWAGFVFNWLYIDTFSVRSGLFYLAMMIIAVIIGGIINSILGLILGNLSYSFIIDIIISILAGLAVPLYLGFKGESIIWKKGKIEDQKEFYAVQKYLSKLGFSLFLITAVIGVIVLIIFILLILAFHNFKL